MIKVLEVTLITGLPKEAEPPFKKISGPKACEPDEEFVLKVDTALEEKSE